SVLEKCSGKIFTYKTVCYAGHSFQFRNCAWIGFLKRSCNWITYLSFLSFCLISKKRNGAIA
ncbi:hypothetical protein LRN10_03305, partial [Cronobacter sakazakii]|uniref:hypothetical protein n=1 Tax=Cronobacter sakazakii TaxID=28141 RepID=UPI001E59EEA2